AEAQEGIASLTQQHQQLWADVEALTNYLAEERARLLEGLQGSLDRFADLLTPAPRPDVAPPAAPAEPAARTAEAEPQHAATPVDEALWDAAAHWAVADDDEAEDDSPQPVGDEPAWAEQAWSAAPPQPAQAPEWQWPGQTEPEAADAAAWFAPAAEPAGWGGTWRPEHDADAEPWHAAADDRGEPDPEPLAASASMSSPEPASAWRGWSDQPADDSSWGAAPEPEPWGEPEADPAWEAQPAPWRNDTSWERTAPLPPAGAWPAEEPAAAWPAEDPAAAWPAEPAGAAWPQPEPAGSAWPQPEPAGGAWHQPEPAASAWSVPEPASWSGDGNAWPAEGDGGGWPAAPEPAGWPSANDGAPQWQEPARGPSGWPAAPDPAEWAQPQSDDWQARGAQSAWGQASDESPWARRTQSAAEAGDPWSGIE